MEENILGEAENEIAHLQALNAELLAVLETLVAIDGGSWHNERYAREKPEAMERARAAIAKARGHS